MFLNSFPEGGRKQSYSYGLNEVFGSKAFLNSFPEGGRKQTI